METQVYKNGVEEPDKYVVFKREDWEQFCQGMGEDGVHYEGGAGIYITDLADRKVEDATVLRDQDVFAGPALHSYAHSIGIAGALTNDPRLLSLADFFHTRALRADECPAKKLPD